MTINNSPDSNNRPISGNQYPTPQRILVVDDDPTIRDIVCRTMCGHYNLPHVRRINSGSLENINMYVMTATDGIDAIAAYEEALCARTPIDMLLTDLTMPRKDGHELVSYLMQKMPSLPILMMSGYSEKPLPVEVKDPDSKIQFLQKPFAIPQLRKSADKVWLNACAKNPDNTREHPYS